MIGEVSPIATIAIIDTVLPIAAIPGIARPLGSVAAGFRVADLPAPVQQAFAAGAKLWREAARTAIAEDVKDPAILADIIFFMQHPERMSAGVGTLITQNETDVQKLRAEWELYFTIASRFLKPSFTPSVFLPERPSRKYEDFVAARTTGKVTLMVHGRNSDGTGKLVGPHNVWTGGFSDVLGTYDSMQKTVESLRAGDSLYIAGWKFEPTGLPIPASQLDPVTRTWGDLLAEKAREGVRIRVIIAQHPRVLLRNISPFMTNLAPLDEIIERLPETKRDNLKYIVSAHSDNLGTHHQKFMVAKKGKKTTAFCGGLDLADGHTSRNWWIGFVWHDVAAKLEGLIARDLERQFVELWNRDRTQSTVGSLAGWRDFETLTLATGGGADKAASLNQQAVQMLRTVSSGTESSKIKRDDIWRGYFRLIGRATRFIYLEDQYFHEPKLADAIVKQVQSSPGMIVIVAAGTGTDDRQTVDTTKDAETQRRQQAAVDITNNGFALRLEFFTRLQVLDPAHLRVYTLNYADGILHTKLILVDDAALSAGSANANPRGFFFDTEVNFVLDNEEAARNFRHELWAHNLGVAPRDVSRWSIGEYFTRWDAVAASNKRLESTPHKMAGEAVIPFHPTDTTDKQRFRAGRRGPIRYGALTFPAPEALF